jgi:hypothetical protein
MISPAQFTLAISVPDISASKVDLPQPLAPCSNRICPFGTEQHKPVTSGLSNPNSSALTSSMCGQNPIFQFFKK